MEKRLIARGLLAGAVGAVLAFVFARLFAEPIIGRAIEFEDGRTEAAHAQGVHEHGAELFSRGVQSNAGLGFGTLIFGIALGALFAVLFCVTYSRSKDTAPQSLSLRLAAAGFVAVYLVPFLKYPPNPPAVGQADSISARTGWYLVMVLISVLVMLAAVWLGRRLEARFGTWNGRLLAVGAHIVTLGVATRLLPASDETPPPLRDASGAIAYPGFPANVLYEFRVVSLATQLVLWASIGLVFATLAGRLLGERVDTGREPSIPG